MNEQSDPRLVRRLQRFAAAASLFSATVGASGLLGAALHIRWLVTWGVEPVTIKVNTSACFVIAGLSLWLLRKENGSIPPAAKLIGRAAAVLLCAIGFVSDLEFLARRRRPLPHVFDAYSAPQRCVRPGYPLVGHKYRH